MCHLGPNCLQRLLADDKLFFFFPDPFGIHLLAATGDFCRTADNWTPFRTQIVLHSDSVRDHLEKSHLSACKITQHAKGQSVLTLLKEQIRRDI